MIKINDKDKCCGCSACEQICPVNAINMKADKQGFLYPQVDKNQCIKCGKCENVCPILNKSLEQEFEQDAFLIQHKDENILAESTSGGAFTAIAQVVLERGGVVFGAAYDEEFNVYHTYVENVSELNIFRNSKYVQSEIRDSFRLVKEFISQERYVCFSGTPCQIEGLLNYIKEESSYLITVDVVCHAVPSPFVWKTYLKLLEADVGRNINDLKFRDKSKYGYLYSQFSIKLDSDGKSKCYQGRETNVMLRAFFSEICNRPSCYNCQFKKRYRRSDITIWDCFDLDKFADSNILQNEKGVSRMLVHSVRGRELIEEILKQCSYEKITPENALHFDADEMMYSVKRNERYDEFWEEFYKNPEKALRSFFPITIKTRTEKILRKIFFKLGLYSLVKDIYRKMHGIVRR